MMTMMMTMKMMMMMMMTTMAHRDLGSSYWPGPAAIRAGVCPKPYLKILN